LETSTAGVDEVEFVFLVGGDAAVCGTYELCFSDGGAFEPLATVEVLPLATDRAAGHARGVFASHRWSVGVDSPSRDLQLTASGVDLRALDPVVILSSSATCEKGKATATVVSTSADVTPPAVDWVATAPSSASNGFLALRFTERVAIPADCLGGFQLRTDSDPLAINSLAVATVACSDARVFLDTVLLDFGPVPAGTYAVLVDSYALTDLAGNPMLYATSDGSFTYTIQTTDTGSPVFVASSPPPSGVTAREVVLKFSENLTAGAGSDAYIELTYCGSDFVCTADDPVVGRFFMADASNVTDDKVLAVVDRKIVLDMAKVGFTVTDYDRFVVRTSATAVADSQGNSAPWVELEFLVGPAGLPHASLLRAASATVSTATFALDVAANTPPGTYAICYCDSSLDSTLNPSDVAASYATTSYTPTFDTRLTASTVWPAVTVGARLLADHLCMTKCSGGCMGSDCHCDGLDDATISTYCLDVGACRTACDLVACAAFSVRGDACELATSATAISAPGWTSFTRQAGAACRDVDDFTTQVGTMTATARAYVGVDYVVTPDESVTIEITGSGLLAGDEVYAGSCNEPCGLQTAAKLTATPSFQVGEMTVNPMVIKRFAGFSFPAGCHKLCFCDMQLAPNGTCAESADYAVELGEVHASGVSCLLEDSRHSRKSCLPMADGGLRCYAELSAAVTVTQNPALPTPDPTPGPTPPPPKGTKCLFGPEEEKEDCTDS
jgi:hypothetical protein